MRGPASKLLGDGHELPVVRCPCLDVGIELLVGSLTLVALEPSTIPKELEGWISFDVLAHAKVALCDAVDASHVEVGRVFQMAIGLGEVVVGRREPLAVATVGRVEFDEPHTRVGGAGEVAGGQSLDRRVEGWEGTSHDGGGSHENGQDRAEPAHRQRHGAKVG